MGSACLCQGLNDTKRYSLLKTASLFWNNFITVITIKSQGFEGGHSPPGAYPTHLPPPLSVISERPPLLIMARLQKTFAVQFTRLLLEYSGIVTWKVVQI